METIFVISLQFLILGYCFHIFPFYFVLLVALTCSGFIIIFERKLLKLLSILPLIFILRLNSTVNNVTYHLGDKINIEALVKTGKGKINKIDGKYVINQQYVYVDKIPNGISNITGVITSLNIKDNNIYYKLDKIIHTQKNPSLLKVYFQNKIENLTENYSHSLKNFYRAILLGEGNRLEWDVIKNFRYTGTAHLLVISGLHISVIISLIIYLLKFSPLSKEIQYVLTLIFLTGYIISIGFYPSVTRAYIMGVIFILGNIIYEKVDPRKSLALAFSTSLLIFPYWLTSVSFILSYWAVGTILFIYPYIPKPKKIKNKWFLKFYNNISLIITIQLSMTPIFIYYFNSLPLLAFLANLVIIPIGTIFIILAFVSLLLSNIYLGGALMPLTNICYEFLIFTVDFFSIIPYLTLEV
ncbi:MAG: ComEC/Rec2 family competence protein [Cetobacterium sp.]|uniref:ComEC/Rec2 family competence protein n=1 Tax=unclassified Cetobacterium TaxID=2630983 RepID=UPI00163D0E70|nr:ComEC/Rec2 family competence protein [Cetobacterium sp. 2A]MBC2855921.1 ComEC/Rec2 family competence protein [Cetobacterium sp. 2A]